MNKFNFKGSIDISMSAKNSQIIKHIKFKVGTKINISTKIVAKIISVFRGKALEKAKMSASREDGFLAKIRNFWFSQKRTFYE